MSRRKVRKPLRGRVQIDVQKLDTIAEKARHGGAITDEEYEELTTSIHTMAERLLPRPRPSEKADALCHDAPGEEESCPQHGPSADHREQKGHEDETFRRGHGRRAAAHYGGATFTKVPHPSLTPSSTCPCCSQGKVYDLKPGRPIVRIVGMPPIQAAVYQLQQLRCNLCGQVFGAEPPAGVGEEKYDATVASMIAQLKYGHAMTFYRIEKLQQQVGVPMPTSVQFELVEKLADALYPVHAELVRLAAQGDVLHHDDTKARILDEVERPEGQDEDRTGLHTTNVIAKVGAHDLALFITGPQHGGENMTDLLKQRAKDLDAAVLMTDALSYNDPKVPPGVTLFLSNCLTHGRRQFVDVYDSFPHECHHVIEQLGKVYWHDEQARQKGMDTQQRLQWHQEKSGPIMAELKLWMQEQIEQKKTEPNSQLGKAINYFLRRWHRLTLFLEHPGAPLDNNVSERALKKAVLHRKNALFFKTQHGADVSDILMGIIHTCELNGVNAFDYMTALQRHSDRLLAAPGDWMPWNYLEAVARASPV